MKTIEHKGPTPQKKKLTLLYFASNRDDEILFLLNKSWYWALTQYAVKLSLHK